MRYLIAAMLALCCLTAAAPPDKPKDNTTIASVHDAVDSVGNACTIAQTPDAPVVAVDLQACVDVDACTAAQPATIACIDGERECAGAWPLQPTADATRYDDTSHKVGPALWRPSKPAPVPRC